MIEARLTGLVCWQKTLRLVTPRRSALYLISTSWCFNYKQQAKETIEAMFFTSRWHTLVG